MVRLMRYLAIFLLSSTAFGQAISYVPKPVAAYVSTTGLPGSWNPLAGSGSSPIPYIPTPAGLYVSTDGTGNAGTWVPWTGTGGSGAASVSNADGTLTISPTTGAVVASLNLGHSNIWTANGALSAPAALWNGTPIATGGTGTTTWPLVLIQPSGTTTTTWSTTGTMFGVNAPSGFTGNLFDFQTNGVSFMKASASGALTGNTANFAVYQTGANCSSAAAPAVCGAATAGSVVIAAAASSVVVNTTRVTANSQITIQQDSSLSTRLAVTCNTTLSPPQVTARTAGTSFTIGTAVTPSANPACYSYTILN